MGDIIKKHNARLLNSSNNTCKDEVPPCNCRNKLSCPLDGKCREKTIIYKATMTSLGDNKNYIGLSSPEFKSRFYNHKQFFEPGKSEMPQNCLKQSGEPRTPESAPPLNGVSPPRHGRTAQELKPATYV